MFYQILYHPVYGSFTLASDEYYIKMLRFGKQIPENNLCTATPEVLRQALQQLQQYLDGMRRLFTVPVAPDGTDFSQRVWQALLDIPYGETRSYGQIASALGMPGGARAVGNACGKNPIGILIPCHRVIGSNGALTGFAGGIHRKQQLLELEHSVLAAAEYT